MSLRTYDYICLCGMEVYDEVVEVQQIDNDIIILDTVSCPTCGKTMHKKIPLSNVQFGDGFFASMGSRRVEVSWEDADGKKHHKNITHKVPTDTSGEK